MQELGALRSMSSHGAAAQPMAPHSSAVSLALLWDRERDQRGRWQKVDYATGLRTSL